MTIINNNLVLAKRINNGTIFSIPNNENEYFMKLNRERIRQVLKGEMVASSSEMAYAFAVRLSNGEFCKIDADTPCLVYKNTQMIIQK